MTLVALLFGGFLINMVGQVTGSYDYDIPPEIVEIIKSAIGAALTILSLGVVAEYRRRGEHKEEIPRIEEKHSDVVDVIPLPGPSDRPCICESDKTGAPSDSPNTTSTGAD